MRIGIVSGYFNPLHQGHLEYIHAAKEQSDKLIVIVNNDRQVSLKGSKPFMAAPHRVFIMQALRDVDEVVEAADNDRTVCATIRNLRKLYPEQELTFFNSGDRALLGNAEPAEVEVCLELGIKYVAIPLPKRYSSSTLLSQL